MKKATIQFLPAILLISLVFFISNASAQTSGQRRCASVKNVLAGKFEACRFRIASGARNKRRNLSNGICRAEFTRRWKRTSVKTSRRGEPCLDASLTSKDYRVFIVEHTKNLSALLGRNVKPLSAAQKRCRADKRLAVSRYTACRYRAKSALAKNDNLTSYNTLISRCEDRVENMWQGIVNRTSRRGAVCFDDDRTLESYKSQIDTHIDKVSAVIAGSDLFEPAPIAVTGSPLELTTDGPAGIISITNTSEFVTATNIQANFTGTALDGKVTETGNTCASVAPNSGCTLSFTPGNMAVDETDFVIQGDNTEATSASISIVIPPPTTAIIAVAGSPLQLTVNGPTGDLTISNTSDSVTALNIVSDFSGTALDGNVVESSNTCASVPPAGSCTLTFTPGNAIVAETNFTIGGDNTNVASASLGIQSGSTLTAINSVSGPASGGTGVILTGTGLTGATSVTFDGVAATSVNVINSTTIAAVTPAHAAGVVDVVVSTPAGGATLADGYTYVATAVGQQAFGGVIGCLNGGLNNLIAATADNSAGIEWSGFGTAVGAPAQSDTDGASNTAAIVAELGNNGGVPYAALLCQEYEVDSQGNSPCQAGNTCYSDWFLPASNNITATGQLNCLFDNRNEIGGFSNSEYWGSTEFGGSPAFDAWTHDFMSGFQFVVNKNFNLPVRCVRAFTP